MKHGRQWLLLVLAVALVSAVTVPLHAQQYEPAEGEAVLYATSDCTGDVFTVVKRGVIYNDLRLRGMLNNGGGVWEHNVACIHVGPNTTVTVFEKANYAGMAFTLSQKNGNGNGNHGRYTMPPRWIDEVSSLKVQ